MLREFSIEALSRPCGNQFSRRVRRNQELFGQGADSGHAGMARDSEERLVLLGWQPNFGGGRFAEGEKTPQLEAERGYRLILLL